MRLRIRARHRDLQRLRLAAGLVLGCGLCIASFGLNNVRHEDASDHRASAPYSQPRRYYLTPTMHPPHEAKGACTPGFHFASFWEISDPSSLVYETELGLTSTDSGSGPPTAMWIIGPMHTVGWVRTGHTASSSGVVGSANCIGWLSSDPFNWGSTAALPRSWAAGEANMGVWQTGVRTCDASLFVWCVEDVPLFADDFESSDASRWSNAVY